MITVSIEKSRTIALHLVALIADDAKRMELQEAVEQAASVDQLKAIVDAIKASQ